MHRQGVHQQHPGDTIHGKRVWFAVKDSGEQLRERAADTATTERRLGRPSMAAARSARDQNLTNSPQRKSHRLNRTARNTPVTPA
jgi:hypothetical protein